MHVFPHRGNRSSSMQPHDYKRPISLPSGQHCSGLIARPVHSGLFLQVSGPHIQRCTILQISGPHIQCCTILKVSGPHVQRCTSLQVSGSHVQCCTILQGSGPHVQRCTILQIWGPMYNAALGTPCATLHYPLGLWTSRSSLLSCRSLAAHRLLGEGEDLS